MARSWARQRSIFRAEMAPGVESLAVVISCDEANALRRVVTLCELVEDSTGGLGSLPICVRLPKGDAGLDKDWVVAASPYTLPEGCLISPEGEVPPNLYRELELALKRVFGWEPWPT